MRRYLLLLSTPLNFPHWQTARAGAYAMWDALARMLDVRPGEREDTLGLCKLLAARLRDQRAA